MAYIGQNLDRFSIVEKLDVITPATATGAGPYNLTKGSVAFVPASADTMVVSINGVSQYGNFTVSGSTITFSGALTDADTCDFIYQMGTGLISTPADGTVNIAKLSATGTKDATTFLRGDNTFATVSGDISSVVAGTNLSGGGISGDVTINLADASTSAKGAASFSSDNFAASSGAVTIKDAGIATAELQDNAITLAKMASGTDGNIISYDASGNPVAVATGNDGQVLTSAGAGAQPAFETLPVGGITEADMHRLTTDFTGNVSPIANNWERVDDASFAKIGTGITNNSGTWSFGATGLYHLIFHTSFNKNADIRYVYNHLNVTVNNSTYIEIAIGWTSLKAIGSTTYTSAECSAFINVDNVSNVKFRVGSNSDSGAAVTMGATANNYTWVQTIRLGDAQ